MAPFVFLRDMKLFTEVEFPGYPAKVNYDSRVLFLGSCFAENIGNWVSGLKFHTTINPLGITYNPLSINWQLKSALDQIKTNHSDITAINDSFIHFQTHGSLRRGNIEELVELINSQLKILNEEISSADFLFLTFGSAIVYRLRETGEVVNNCHRFPNQLFGKELLNTEEMFSSLMSTSNGLLDLNPNLNILLTVSPIRHLRHGAIQNQRSKARLIDLCGMLEKELEQVSYIPIYELVMDELRDYRFYRQDDLIHLNEAGLRIIESRFKNELIHYSAHPLMDRIERWQRSMNHTIRDKDSSQSQKFAKNLQKETKELNNLLEGRFEEELRSLKS